MKGVGRPCEASMARDPRLCKLFHCLTILDLPLAPGPRASRASSISRADSRSDLASYAKGDCAFLDSWINTNGLAVILL